MIDVCIIITINKEEGTTDEVWQGFDRVPLVGEVIELDEGIAGVIEGYNPLNQGGCFKVAMLRWRPVLSVVPPGKQQRYYAALYLEEM